MATAPAGAAEVTALMAAHYNAFTEPPGDWIIDAACYGLSGTEHGYTDFFGDPPSPRAQAACASCPVRPQCLEYALEHQPYGYWAGTTEGDRRKLRRQRRTTASSSDDLASAPAAAEPVPLCPGCRGGRSMPLGGGHRECADCGARWPA